MVTLQKQLDRVEQLSLCAAARIIPPVVLSVCQAVLPGDHDPFKLKWLGYNFFMQCTMWCKLLGFKTGSEGVTFFDPPCLLNAF